jgi:molybdopterin/thiamine biosynthesis adenylyltransferase
LNKFAQQYLLVTRAAIIHHYLNEGQMRFMNNQIRPLFKRIQLVHEIKPGVLRLGEFFKGTGVEIEDEDGSILKLIQLMDGTRTIPELFHELKQLYDHIQLHEVEAAIDELHDLGFLLDYSAVDRSSLTDLELHRFKANLDYFSFYSTFQNSPWAIQEKLKSAHVTIIGVGAFGSSLIFNLAGLGVSQVRVVDFDTVDLSNLNRQMLFNETDIGKLKVDVVKDFLTRFYSGMKVETVCQQIRSVDDVVSVIQGTDIVLLAADQPLFLLQRWINTACVAKRIPFITGGINVISGFLFTVVPYESGCIDCLHLLQSEQNPDYIQTINNILHADKHIPNAAIASNLMIVCGMISSEIVRYFTGIGPLLSKGTMINIDFMTLEKESFIDFTQQHHACPTCGEGNGQHSVIQLLGQAEKAWS